MSKAIRLAGAGVVLAGVGLLFSGCGDSDSSNAAAKNVLFFLGDGMGTVTQTAARIYSVGEDGQLTMDTLPNLAWVRTYSNDAQVTDSAPSMAAYMTGVKMNNEVISMSADTSAYDGEGHPFISGADSTCPASSDGTPVTTFLELAKAAGKGTGAVTTTRVTHATPATTYSHLCHRDGENAISVQAVPGGAGYNAKLGDGLDVLFGGGRRHWIPKSAQGSSRTDERDLVAEMKAKGYSYASNKTEFDAIPASATKALGLFTASHMSYDLDRDPAKEPSLAEMTGKAIDLLSKHANGFFLMVEGGRIDHALHETNAIRALQDTVAFDNALRAAIEKMNALDPGLKNTLILVTADHDHTIVLNGYARRTGKTTAENPGVLGVVRNVVTGEPEKDAEGKPYGIIGFGNGENRTSGPRASQPDLDGSATSAKTYHQEAAVRMAAGAETHGGTDVPAMAVGAGSEALHGFKTNTELFQLLRDASGL